MRKAVAIVAVLLAVISAEAQSQTKSKNKKKMHALVTNAQFVMVTNMWGDEFSRNSTGDDRRAIYEVEEKIRKWGRYKLVYRPEDADLIIVVRRGALLAVTPGVSIGRDTRLGTHRGVGVAVESGDPDDSLAVYDARGGSSSAPLWRASGRDGLHGNVPLFERFRRDVEAADSNGP